MSSAGELVTERFAFDGGRLVTAYVPRRPPEAVVFAGDGELIAPWGAEIACAGGPATLIVGIHRAADDMHRLHEYSPGFAPERFAPHERFLRDDVRTWMRARFGADLPRERTATCGVSAGGEFALAFALRHPDIIGAMLCASPGAGFRPPDIWPDRIPRAYFVAGTREPFFHANARRWAEALRGAGADVRMCERDGSHGDDFWRTEFPAMVGWAFAH